jgi:hypothetical protein
LRRANRLDGVQTFRAHRNTGDVIERCPAESAIRREEDGENASQEGLHRRDEEGTLLGALLSSFSF